MIKNDIIFNTIDNGIIILDEKLNILAWNHWLEIRTNIKEDEIKNKNICEQFPYINEKKLKRKIKAVIVTNNASYYSVDPHKFLIDIKTNAITDNIFDSMQQDITIVPYDKENKLVCLYIYDKTSLYKTNFMLEKLNDKLRDLSNRDPMTRSFNRRYFYEESKKMVSLSLKNNKNITLVILDIDKFKNINDTYGHAIGDDVIILLARKLEEFVRNSDVVFRFGGEEFVILLNNACQENAYNVIEKIRKRIENLEIDNKKEKIHFTISAGIAEYCSLVDVNNIENTLKRADDALYIAKESGRNKVVNANKKIIL